MDPMATLLEIRDLAAKIKIWQDSGLVDADDETAPLADALAERVTALDEWITKGGFLPGDWAAAQARARRRH